MRELCGEDRETVQNDVDFVHSAAAVNRYSAWLVHSNYTESHDLQMRMDIRTFPLLKQISMKDVSR